MLVFTNSDPTASKSEGHPYAFIFIWNLPQCQRSSSQRDVATSELTVDLTFRAHTLEQYFTALPLPSPFPSSSSISRRPPTPLGGFSFRNPITGWNNGLVRAINAKARVQVFQGSLHGFWVEEIHSRMGHRNECRKDEALIGVTQLAGSLYERLRPREQKAAFEAIDSRPGLPSSIASTGIKEWYFTDLLKPRCLAAIMGQGHLRESA